MPIPDYISLDTVRNAKYKLMTISESSGVHMHMLIMLHVKARNYLKHLFCYITSILLEHGRLSTATHWLEITECLRVPEGLHDHGVHGGEVLLDPVGTAGRVTDTEVELQVEGEVRHPEWVHHVLTHQLQPLDALLAGVRPGLGLPQSLHVADARCLADVSGPVNEVVLYHHEERLHVVADHLVLALLGKLSKTGAVVVCEIGLEQIGLLLDEVAQVLHLEDTLPAVEELGLGDGGGEGGHGQDDGSNLHHCSAVDLSPLSDECKC